MSSQNIDDVSQLGQLLLDASKNGDLVQVKTLLSQSTPISNDGLCHGITDRSSLVHFQNANGNTALVMAAQYGHSEIIRFLLQMGADIGILTNYGQTALMFASTWGHSEAVRLLIQCGADTNIKDINGNTALMFASAHGHLGVVQLLTQAGANVNIKDKDEQTALMLASKNVLLMFGSNNNRLKVIYLLLRSGADPNIQDKSGRTAFDMASDIEIRNIFINYPTFKENIKKLEDLQLNKLTYFSVIPKDISFIIENQLENDFFRSLAPGFCSII